MPPSRNQSEGLLFLAVIFLTAVGGAVVGISPWILVPLAIVLGCVFERTFRRRSTPDEPPADPAAKPLTKVAVDFASALVDGDFARARSFLTQDFQETLTCAQLRSEFYAMFGYAEGKPTGIHFEDECAHEEDWPSRHPGDVGWVYISIRGEDFLEAVTVTVTKTDNEYRIRDVEWGRP